MTMTNEEQTAYDLTVENHERAMDRVAELEREVSALKAQPSGLVLPEAANKDHHELAFEITGTGADAYVFLRDELDLFVAAVKSKASGVSLDRYDAGLLNDFGGGNVGWWQDYIRSELDRAHDFYQSQMTSAALGVVAPSREDRELITDVLGFEFEKGELQTVNESDLIRLVTAARLNQQPASGGVDERAAFSKAYNAAVDDGFDSVRDLARQIWQARAAQPQQAVAVTDEVRRLREALESARSHCVTWQGEPHEYICSVHKAVIGVVDAALTQSPKGEEE